MTKRHLTGALALGAAATLVLAGCSSDGGGGSDGDSLGELTIGYIPSYTDTLVTAFLAQDQLERLGYSVELTELSEVGVVYTALANGDLDIYPSAWPDMTHATYVEQYEGDLEDLGTFYDQAQNFLAVPTYTDIDSIEDLAENPDLFGGEIIGIESGAGLTEQTQTVAMPEYGLDGDFELVTSSTAAMLTELEARIANEEDIVVTLWKPYWANGAFDLKELEDPKGGMGEPETMHTFAHAGFAEEFPEAAEYFAGFVLDDDQWSSLENTVVNDYDEGQEADAVAQWIEENPDAYDTLVAD